MKNLWLYDKFANWCEKGNVWFYSDPHFDDPDMNWRNISSEEQVRRINSKVGKNDTIVFLGDIGNADWIKKVKGYKVLVMGNHDEGASNFRRLFYQKSFKTVEDAELAKARKDIIDYSVDFDTGLIHGITDNKLFDEVYQGPVVIGEKIILSHEPINIPNMLNIHGHNHNSKNDDSTHINICCEFMDYTPIPLKDLVSNKIGKIKSIHRATIDKAGWKNYANRLI